jgi:hypothetical protein
MSFLPPDVKLAVFLRQTVYELESMIKCDADENNYDALFDHKIRINILALFECYGVKTYEGMEAKSFTLRKLYP